MMPETTVSKSTKNIENRKLRLITQIAQMSSESMLSRIEELMEEGADSVLTKEEMEIVDKRLAEFQANPTGFVTLAELSAKLQSL